MTVSEELDTIHTGAGIFPLTDRAFLRVTGPDATRWLNGMVTNSIQSLQPGEGNYNFLLNAQGRIMGDCTIYRDPSEHEPVFLLETDGTQIDAIHQLLDKFIIMDDVELTAAFTDESSLLLLGPKAPAALQHLALPVPEPLRMLHADTPHGPALLLTPVASNVFELRADIATIMGLRTAANLFELSPESIEAHRILSGTPRYGTDIRNSDTAKDLPQETAQTHALHFAKGCYLGQEIVERIRSRGQVHRTFTRFTLTGEMPSLPAQLTANDKPAGDITSAVLIGDTIHALGYIRRELLETHAPITYTGGTATPSASR